MPKKLGFNMSREKGNLAEDKACKFLSENHFHIVERNYYSRFGEIDIIAIKDSNTAEDKFNIGIVQGFSELADQIASSKNIELSTTIPNETRYIIKFLQVIVISGALLILWLFMFRPLYMRIKNGKK